MDTQKDTQTETPTPAKKHKRPEMGAVLQDTSARIEAKRTENGTEIVLTSTPPAEPTGPIAPAPVTERGRTRLEAEMAAGRRNVEHHEQIKLMRPAVVLSEAERRAQGTSIPVFRPGEGEGSAERERIFGLSRQGGGVR